MSWRTIMGAGKSPEAKFTDPTKPSTESTKPTEKANESPNQESFVDIVDESEGSQNLTTSEYPPFQPGETLVYRVPDPTSRSIHPPWVEHTGQVLTVDGFREEVVIRPIDEPGEPWRLIWLGYVRKVNDGQA